MSLKAIGLGGLLVVAGVSAPLFWNARSEGVVRPASHEPAEAAASKEAATPRLGAPVIVPPLPISNGSSNRETALASSWQRPHFARWVQRAKLTTEEEERALQILADAQTIYNESADVRDLLKAKAWRLRRARITPAQRARLAPVIEQDHALVMGTLTGAAAQAAAHLYRETWEAVDAELDATMPEAERQANEDAEQVERDLDIAIKTALNEFLTSEQVESFDDVLGPVSLFLKENYDTYASAQDAAERASRRR